MSSALSLLSLFWRVVDLVSPFRWNCIRAVMTPRTVVSFTRYLDSYYTIRVKDTLLSWSGVLATSSQLRQQYQIKISPGKSDNVKIERIYSGMEKKCEISRSRVHQSERTQLLVNGPSDPHPAHVWFSPLRSAAGRSNCKV